MICNTINGVRMPLMTVTLAKADEGGFLACESNHPFLSSDGLLCFMSVSTSHPHLITTKLGGPQPLLSQPPCFAVSFCGPPT
jgi:hypothetical protein